MRNALILLSLLALGCKTEPEAAPVEASNAPVAEPQPSTPPPKASSGAEAPAAKKSTSAIDVDAAAAAIKNEGALVLDVRTQEEFATGALDGAKLVPYDSVAARIAEIEGWAPDHDTPVVVYCRSGHRAKTAHKALSEAGYTHVINGGGYEDLAAALE